VIEAVCTSCHTPKWSPDWDLRRALEQIAHTPRAE
jgi:ubiquitin-protein ligase